MTALILGALFLTSPSLLAQDANTTQQADKPIEIESIALPNRHTKRNVLFRIYRDKDGTHYVVDNEKVTSWKYNYTKGLLVQFGRSQVDASTIISRGQARELEVLRELGLPPETTVRVEQTDIIMGFEHYIIKGQHYYYVFGEPAPRAAYEARVSLVTAMFLGRDIPDVTFVFPPNTH